MRDSISQGNKKTSKKWMILSIIGMIVLWEVCATLVGREIILPSPFVTFQSGIRIIMNENFWTILGNTITRSIISFVIAFGLAIILGLGAGFHKRLYDFLHPIVLVNRAIPTISIILLAIIWLRADNAPILVGVIMIFPILYLNTVEGVRNIDKKLLQMVHLYKINRWKVMKKLYLPSIRQYVIAGSLAAASLNIKVVIAAEVFSQPRLSIGTSFQIARANLQTADLFAWSFIVILIAAIFDVLIKKMEQLIFPLPKKKGNVSRMNSQ